MRSVVLILGWLATLPLVQPGELTAQKVLVNTDTDRLALQGYDPVAFFTQQRPVPGLAAITAEYGGALYRFSSAEHRTLFEQDPMKYEPAFGGYCAYAVSQGGIAPVDVTTFQFIEGRLVLNKNPEVLELFNRERDARYRKATANWPGIVERRGK
jgi:YHS domain-containing protein